LFVSTTVSSTGLRGSLMGISFVVAGYGRCRLVGPGRRPFSQWTLTSGAPLTHLAWMPTRVLPARNVTCTAGLGPGWTDLVS